MSKKKNNNLGWWLLIGGLLTTALVVAIADFVEFKSKYFKYHDLVNTAKTTIDQHPEQFNPPKAYIDNANYLAKHTLDPLFKISPYYITSWFRSPYVNNIVGGADSSKHLTAEAVDIVPDIMFDTFLDILEQSDIPFTKAINEHDHIHITLVAGQEGLRQIIS